MKLNEFLYRVLRQPNRSFLFSATSGVSFNGAKSHHVPCGSCRSIAASGRKPPTPDGSHHRSSFSFSGVHSPCWITNASFCQLGQSKGNQINVNDFKFLSVTLTSCRFISGGPALWGLVAANSAVFAMWQTMDLEFMKKHFMFSAANVANGRWHTLISAAFSHASLEHLLWNILGLLSFGMLVEEMYGGAKLLMMYAGASMCGSFGHIKYVTLVYPWLKGIPLKSFDMGSAPGYLGASGVVIAFVILIILHHPNHTVDFVLWSMPAAAVGLLIVGKDLYFALKGGESVSVGAHLGGAVYGLLMYSTTQLYGSMLGP